MQSHDNMLEVEKNLGTRVGSIGFVNLFRDTKLLPRNNIYQFHTFNIACIPITFYQTTLELRKTLQYFLFCH